MRLIALQALIGTMDALKLDVMVYPSFLDPPRFVGDDLGPVGELLLWLVSLVTDLALKHDVFIDSSYEQDDSTRLAAPKNKKNHTTCPDASTGAHVCNFARPNNYDHGLWLVCHMRATQLMTLAAF